MIIKSFPSPPDPPPPGPRGDDEVAADRLTRRQIIRRDALRIMAESSDGWDLLGGAGDVRRLASMLARWIETGEL